MMSTASGSKRSGDHSVTRLDKLCVDFRQHSFWNVRRPSQFGLLSRGRAVFVDEIWTQCRAQQLRCIICPKFHVQSRGTQCQRMHPIFLIDFRTWGSLATDKLKDDWSFAAKVRLFKKLASTCPKMRTLTRPATQRSLTNVTRLRSCAAVTPCLTGDSRLLGDCAWRSNQVQDPYHQNDCQGDATQLDLVSICSIIFEFSGISYVICPLSSCKLKSFRTKTDLSLPKSVCPWVVASLHTFKAGLPCIASVASWMCNGCLQRFTGINDQECSTGPGQKSQTTTRRQGHAGTTGQNEHRESDPNRPSVA